MTTPSDPEAHRLAALHALHLLDTAAEERFDRITRMAQTLFNVPIALISLVDADRQWFKSHQGIDLQETPRAVSFCAHAIEQDAVFVVEDARLDDRFASNPLVSGAPFIRFYAGYPLTSSDGSKLGTLCLLDRRSRPFSDGEARQLQDLAAWAQTEISALESRQAERSALLARLGHELRTPLTSVLGALGLLQEGVTGPLPPALSDFVDMAMQNSRQLAQTVDKLLTAERLLKGSTHVDLQPVELAPLLAQLAREWQEAAARRPCRLEVGRCDAGSVMSDRSQLAAALGHLIDNACRYSPIAGVVELSAAAGPDGWTIVVQDEGSGLAPDVMAHLFEPFTQAEQDQFTAHGGCGLGLFLCRTLVEALGGHVSASNREPRGARFAIQLP